MIATKADKIKRSQLKKHLNIIKNTLKLESTDQIVPYSSMTKQGKDEVWMEIDGWLEYVQNNANEEVDE